VYDSSGTIPSRTPLLFSVGPGDERLVREERRRSDPTNAASDGEPKEVKETVYVLRGGSYYWPWSNESVLVFPLPK
ncbi:MAG: hypothetical protein L0Z07_04275, partial [Planctomycetes bacterium]|nr:hypothetical protein [Planctomycetota bacterium]